MNVQEMKVFSKVYGANVFSTRLISCYYVGFIGLLSLL